jgi:hypothetical protein
MAFTTFDIVTALTIGSIGTILLLYIIVLKRKGWLKRNAVETHYLCPNPKCRKPFAQPVPMADLSKTPPESYPACPNCGLNLNTVEYFREEKNFDFQSLHIATSSKKPIERTQLSKREAAPTTGEKLKFQGEKKPSGKDKRDCPHFFGYVRNLPKNTPIPDDCLGCPWIVECLTAHAEKVEA